MNNKYARSDPDWTPNNYDLIINGRTTGINVPDALELAEEIQELIPITKRVHIHMESQTSQVDYVLRFSTSIRINGELV